MSACSHPTSALYVDRQRGKTHCTLCGDVVVEEQFELDPIFGRGGGGGGGGVGRPVAMSSMSGGIGGGSYRPSASFKSGGMSHARPTIDRARREMLNIARQLEISDETVERALAIYKMALSVNATSGTRPAVLGACLYAACRRERTSHVIYDFVEVTGGDAHGILSQMKIICHATHTEVPVVDPSCYVQRFAEQMNLGDRVADVVVCALKVLRAMQDDWISCGRRPMGVCAAALLVACYVFGIPRAPEQVCGMVRLTAHTISKRLTEFAATPTAALESIDSYVPSSDTLPPAFKASSRKSTEEDVHASIRELSAIYYELVAEAKTSQPATAERCEKWSRFLQKHCELEGITPSEENLDLPRLSPEQQLHILGLPHTKPIPLAEVERSVKAEEQRLLVKREESLNGGGGVESDRWATGGSSMAEHSRERMAPVKSSTDPGRRGGLFSSASLNPPTDASAQQPASMKWMTDEFTRLLSSDAEVMGLVNDFDFAGDDDGVDMAATQNSGFTATASPSFPGQWGSPPPSTPVPGMDDPEAFCMGGDEEDEAMRNAIDELLYDQERRHALPWEFIVLPNVELDDCTDFLPYLVLDNEERLRRQQIGESLYRERWGRGRARTVEEIDQLTEARALKRRRRHVISEPAASLPTALERALRGRGAASVNVSQIEELIPGLLDGEEDEANAEWDM